MKVPERTVVVVHGIGQQVAGATATAWAESFVRFCEAQGRRAEVVETNDDAAFRLVLADGAPGTLRDAVVAEPVLRLRIVEARWAEAFEAPTALSVLRWLLWYGPNLAFAQVFLTRRAHRWLRAATEHRIAETGTAAELTTGDAAAHRAASSTTSLGPVLYLLGGLVLLAVAGPVVLVLGLLALLAALVPSDTVRSAAARVLSVVSAQVGDVSTYLSSPVARGAMEGIIERCVHAEVARAGSDRVHVLAHSQGAALAHAVLARSAPAHRPRGFTTLGGAHGRLHDMRLLRFPGWTVVPIVLTALAWLLAFPVHGRFGWAGLLVAPGAVSVATLVLLLVVGATSVRALGHTPSPGTVRGVSWLDLWAPFDPVHHGRPVAAPSRDYLGQTVPGRMVFVLDHVFYEKDWHESVPRVLAHVTAGLRTSARLGAQRGVRERRSLRDPEGQGPNWTPWSRRDWVSFACRALTLVTGVVLVAVCGRQVMAIGEQLRGLAPWTRAAAERADALWTRWWGLFGGLPDGADVPGGTNRVIGGVVVLVAALVVAHVVKGAYWGAVTAEARAWARSLPAVRTGDRTEPFRWSVGTWAVRGGAITLAWAVLLGGLVRAVVGGS